MRRWNKKRSGQSGELEKCPDVLVALEKREMSPPQVTDEVGDLQVHRRADRQYCKHSGIEKAGLPSRNPTILHAYALRSESDESES